MYNAEKTEWKSDDRRAWGASIQIPLNMNSTGNVSSTHPKWTPTQVQAQVSKGA